jgi:hypothetical protein
MWLDAAVALSYCTVCSDRGLGLCESGPFVLNPKVLPVTNFGSIHRKVAGIEHVIQTSTFYAFKTNTLGCINQKIYFTGEMIFQGWICLKKLFTPGYLFFIMTGSFSLLLAIYSSTAKFLNVRLNYFRQIN